VPQNLKLIEARVDEGPRMKRVQPRAQGRAYRILKRTSHITIIVQEVEPQPRKPKKPTVSRAQAARAAKQTPAPQARTAPVEAEETKPIAAPVAEETPAPQPQPAVETTHVAEGPHVANVEDKTDEIGAPIVNDNETDADKA